jgi:hypothetical protein
MSALAKQLKNDEFFRRDARVALKQRYGSRRCNAPRSDRGRTFMQTELATFRIDPTPRRADGEYMAHARIRQRCVDGTEMEVCASGDLAGFDSRDDAIAFAIDWAETWLERRLA